jgi:hypothetical protein
MTDEERYMRNKRIVSLRKKKISANGINRILEDDGYGAVSPTQICRICQEYGGKHPAKQIGKVRKKGLKYVQQTSKASKYKNEWPLIENTFNDLAKKGIPVAMTQEGNDRIIWKKGPWWVQDKQRNISIPKEGNTVIFGDIIKTANGFEDLL